jgi:microcystin synthetase protein McyJ
VALSDDVRHLSSAWLQVLAKPNAWLREMALMVRGDPQSYYAFLGDDVLEAQDQGFADRDKPLWLNLGYWEKARAYPDACADLARRLARAARFAKGDTVVDCGFGFGEQDLLWMREFELGRIVGVNVTPLHVEVARKRMQAHGLGDRVDLKLASATQLPLEAGSADKVVALESAFHFDTREQFFAEAHRVLKPGGRIATADCVPFPGEAPSGLVNRLVWRRWGVPVANIYDRNAYREKLEGAGFEDVEIESIRNYVFPGMHRYAELRRQGKPMDDARIELSAQDIERCLGVELWQKQGGLSDYVIFSAVKA